MTSAADELAYRASLLPPLVPEGRALAHIIITCICLFFSWILVSLRTWCRAIWLSKVWGLDDTLAVLGLIAFTVTSTYAILTALYGFGTPDYKIHPLDAYSVRSLQYNCWWEVSYLFTSALVKTSIGVAVIRIALERRYRYTVYAFLGFTNAACIGGVIWQIAACRPIATRWNPYVGSCNVPGLVPIAYAITAVTVITDAGFALVPIFILRRLTMSPRVKYGLMFVLALGSVAAFASVARYPNVKYFDATEDYMYDNVWIPLVSQIELSIGLVSGSLPGIAKLFHFFDPPDKPRSDRGEEGWAARHSIGGTPLDDFVELGDGSSRLCVSENSSHRRPSVPKLSIVSLKGVWQVRTMKT